ncbi:MAG: hypothetical protein FJX69_12540 [Alphaproteobacteria bacterium]|nr:hypothetical protein [Alphaproteobacteria bacterium]
MEAGAPGGDPGDRAAQGEEAEQHRREAHGCRIAGRAGYLVQAAGLQSAAEPFIDRGDPQGEGRSRTLAGAAYRPGSDRGLEGTDAGDERTEIAPASTRMISIFDSAHASNG